MKRVLAIGSTGMFGVTFVRILEAAGYTVIRHAGSSAGDVSADLTLLDSARDLLRRCAVDVVVNLAALTNVDVCEEKPNEAFLFNTRLVENLVAAIAGEKVQPHLIQISTDQVYDGPGPHVETNVTLRNYYAFSKYAGELAAERIGATVVRTNFFGLSEHATRKSFSDWIYRGLAEGQILKVFEDVEFSPLSIGTLSEMLCHCIQKPVEGVFNVGSADGMSKAAFCFSFAAALNMSTDALKQVSVNSVSLPARRPMDMRMNCSKFEGTFGVKMPSLIQEIDLMKRFYHAGS